MSSQDIAVVDFGSYTTRLLIVDKVTAKVVVYAAEKSEGVAHGVIVDLEKATHMIKRLVDQARQKMDYRLSRVYCSISGDSITSIGSHSVVKIRHQEISQYDMDDVFATAAAITLENQKVIHLLPKQYKVDNQSGIMDPLGMYGIRLEGEFHLILVDQGVAQNLVRCFTRVGIQVEGFVFMPVGMIEAVLYHDEKQQGVVLVDIGEGTTDFVVCHDGVVKFSGSIPIGGGAVTRDLAHRLKVDNTIAERLKLAIMKHDHENHVFEEGITIKDIKDVISARYIQIIKLIEQQVVREGLKKCIDRGYVLCGGGSQYRDLPAIIEHTFSRSCRLGGLADEDLGALSRAWLGAVGLVYYVRQKGDGTIIGRNNPCRKAFKMLQRWLEVYF